MTYNLISLMDEVVNEMKSAGIDVNTDIILGISENKRLSRALGKCRMRNGYFRIELSHTLLATQPIDKIKATLMHEIVHTLFGCFNHGEKFTSYIDKLDSVYGYFKKYSLNNGSYVASKIEINEAYMKEVKHIIKCEKCGQEIYFQRKINLVKYPELYRCKCGGKLKVVK